MRLLTAIFVLLNFGLISQTKNELSVDFSVNRQHFKMEEMDEVLTDTTIYLPNQYKSDLKTINSGINYSLMVKFQPIEFMNFGGFIGFQQAYRNSDFQFDISFPEEQTIYAINRINVRSLSYGFVSELHLGNLLNFDSSQKTFLKFFQISIPMYFGFAQSRGEEQINYGENSNFQNVDYMFSANANFYGKFGLKLGYQVLQRPLRLNIGLEGGYCFNKSSDVKRFNNSTSVNWKNSSYNLDFSGVYYGLYLKIGK